MGCSETSVDEIFFFNDTATTEIYTLSLHDALPIWYGQRPGAGAARFRRRRPRLRGHQPGHPLRHREPGPRPPRSEEHTSELQSRQYLVCRLLLEKKKQLLNQHANLAILVILTAPTL